MRYLSLVLLVSSVICFCVWQQLKTVKEPIVISNGQQNIGVKWNDSLRKYLPKNLDTSIIVKDALGTPLTFWSYFIPVFNHEAMIYQDKGQWRLQRLTKEARDSLAKEDYGISRVDRYEAYRTIDTVSSWKEKLNQISHTLAQADYVLVLKRQRKMIVKRKGIEVLTFSINLGRSPVGNKVFDGDGKTPEGIYHLDNKQEREDGFHKSFWISYPNEADKRRAKAANQKPGVGIMIHGTTPKKLNAKDWTAGCIALQNKDLDTLFNHVSAGTIIEIRK